MGTGSSCLPRPMLSNPCAMLCKASETGLRKKEKQILLDLKYIHMITQNFNTILAKEILDFKKKPFQLS